MKWKFSSESVLRTAAIAIDLNSMTSVHSKWQFSSVSSEILFDEKYNQIVQDESDLFYSDLILKIVFPHKLCETL